MKHMLPALRMLIVMTVLTGVAYPLLVTGIATVFFSQQASGSLTFVKGAIVGSDLIGQSFESPRYFHSRPSAVDNNPLTSGGSNLSPASSDLKKLVQERILKNTAENPTAGFPPADLVFASASGLDPHISPQAATYQVSRVASARGLDTEIVQKLVTDLTERPQFGILGEPRVNVLQLNLAVDRLTVGIK